MGKHVTLDEKMEIQLALKQEKILMKLPMLKYIKALCLLKVVNE